MFDSGGEMQAVRHLQIEVRRSSYARRSLAHCGRERKHLEGWISKEGLIVGNESGVAFCQRACQTFRADRIAAAIESPAARTAAMRAVSVGPQSGFRSTK